MVCLKLVMGELLESFNNCKERKSKESDLDEFQANVFLTESLILAQNERWRRG